VGKGVGFLSIAHHDAYEFR
jgi:hypothetical protein